MKKYKLIRGAIFALGFSTLNPVLSYASEKTYFGYTEEELKEKAKKYGSELVEWCQEVDQTVQDEVIDPAKEKVSEVPIYKHESLWLITDMPTIDPNEERHYYFIDKNTLSIKKTFFYDQEGKKVDRNSSLANYKEDREMYVSLTNMEDVFKIEYWMNLRTFESSINYIDFDSFKIFDKETTAKYGRFVHIEDIIPEDKIQEKYSTKDLLDILNLINDVNYELNAKDTFALERK